MPLKSNVRKAKRMNHARRLQVARKWIAEYTGKHIVKGYARWFGVDLLCAIKELRLSGIEISVKYEIAVKRSIEAGAKQKMERKKRKQENLQMDCDSNNEFAFIAGYTTGGASYGIKWEETDDV